MRQPNATPSVLQSIYVRYALRTLRKNLGLTLMIVASLAIGIGANSAIFSIVDALLLHPLPYPNPDRLAAIWLHSPGLGIFRDWPSPGQYTDLRAENRSFEEMALAQSRNFTLTGRDQPERLGGMRAQSGLLRILGARPQLGRLLSPDEDVPGRPSVAILSDAIWKRLFNSDPHIVGKSITLNGTPITVAGVLQPGFLLNAEIMPSEGPLDNVDVYLPLPLGADAVNNRGDENYNILVRLKPGRHSEAGSGRCRRHCQSHSHQRQAAPNVRHGRDRAAGAGGRRCPAAAAGAAWLRRLGSTDRLRQCRQPAAYPRFRTAQGNRHPHRPGRGMAAAGTATPYRNRLAGGPRRCCRTRHRPGGHSGRPAPQSRQYSAPGGHPHRRYGRGVHVGDFLGHRLPLRARTRLQRHPGGPQHHAKESAAEAVRATAVCI